MSFTVISTVKLPVLITVPFPCKYKVKRDIPIMCLRFRRTLNMESR